MNLHDFDAIRPVEPNELPAAFDALLADATFCTNHNSNIFYILFIF